MKFHFEPNLDYQLEAIEAVCDLFNGQEICRTEFTVTRDARLSLDPSAPATQERLDFAAQALQARLDFAATELGIGNRLSLLDDDLLENLHGIQLKNGLAPSGALKSGDFTVEMETGTGKTYVYLRTIFELNKRYGFNKFVIVVPSVAIKEGVYKTLQITEEHFKSLYSGIPYKYFLYDSSKPGPVRSFATSNNIQIMVVTVGAINKKDVNNLYKDSEKTGGEKPIDLIKATNPIIIVDEPQSVDGGLEGRGKEALDAMNPLCTLRYSATHVDKHHMVYRLDAVDAYEKRLVKQIEVASATVEDAYNKPYVRLVSVSNKRGTITARIELDIQAAGSIRRQEVTVMDGDDLEQTARRAIYADHRIGEINTAKGSEFMELRYPGGEIYLKPGQAHAGVDALAMQRQMIQRTIKEHLDKEKRLRPQGIKVLSLFFIDSVEKYRKYDADGNMIKGDYARIFEEEYTRLAKHPDYHTLFEGVDLSHAPEEVHNGYFSIDKKGKWAEPELNNEGELKNQTSRDNAERAYQLIMQKKEELLSFGTPLKFIFSHSALKEGWDNPNVFQICTLRDIQTERERRQTIGRGLRLCVNQNGDRLRGADINTLTVIATESYEQFAENLQKEIEKDTGLHFGIVEQHQFAAIAMLDESGTTSLGFEHSKTIWEHLKENGYIDHHGKVQDSLRQALKANTLKLPEDFEPQRGHISEILRKLSGRLEIKNADDRQQVRTRQAVLESAEFKALWDRIKHKTTYRVQFDNERLIEKCTEALRNAPAIPKTRLQWRKADIAIGKAGVTSIEKREGAYTRTLEENDIQLPDLITDLQDRTQLTRRSIVRILIGSDRLNDFKQNPQQFIELAGEAINRCKRLALVDGIKYQRLGADHYYAQELFEQKELTGYLKNMLMDARKSVYEHVVYDYGVERNFADELEKNDDVKVYAKLPGWFKVPTPLGTYNPDWAVLVDKDGEERLYFVVETKSSLFAGDLRSTETGKIDCAKVHFKALTDGDNPAKYVMASSIDDLI